MPWIRKELWIHSCTFSYMELFGQLQVQVALSPSKAPVKYEAMWALELVHTLWRKVNCLVLSGNRTTTPRFLSP